MLIVDDTEASRYSLRRMLELAQFSVHEAVTGQAAIEKAAQNPDLIILDVQLPDMSGYEVCEILKADPRTAPIPVLHLSASFTESENRSQGLERGADGYLTYPIEPRELVANIRALLRAREAEQLALGYARQWQATFDAIQDGVALVDGDGTFVRCNLAMARLAGQPVNAMLGRNCHDLFSIPAADSPLTRMLQTGARQKAEMLVEGRWLHIAADPVAGDPRSRAHGVLNISDVSERHETQAELQRRADRLMEMDRRKDEFLAMLAHELRNPLAPIRNAVEVLRRAPENRVLSAQSLDVIARQVGHMARLIDDLLDVSRITRGRIQLRTEQVDLVRIIDRAVETLRPPLRERAHTLRCSLPPTPLMVAGDPTRLEQVIANLLHNAIKYTDPGGKIDLTLERQGADALLRVRDSGIGMTPDVLARVFDLFMQADGSLARSQGGLGIGLTLSKTLVELHRGGITVASDGPGKGSEFTVRLPILCDAPSCETSPPAAPRNGTSVRRRVLIVEDNVDSANMLETLLRLHGHEVLSAADGAAALTVMDTFVPDLVLLDIGLPGMDGFQVAEQIRSRKSGRNIVLIALTGYGQEADRRRSAEAGFDYHFVKPIDLEELAQLLESQPLPAAEPF